MFPSRRIVHDHVALTDITVSKKSNTQRYVVSVWNECTRFYKHDANAALPNRLYFEHVSFPGNRIERPIDRFEQNEYLTWFSHRAAMDTKKEANLDTAHIINHDEFTDYSRP
jgi:hypothetical protein